MALSRALAAAERAVAAGTTAVAEALAAARAELEAEGIEPEYLEARDAVDLEPVESFNGRPVLVAVAARVGPGAADRQRGDRGIRMNEEDR